MFCLELGYLVLGVVQQLSQNFFSMLTLHGRRRCNAITDPLYLHWISRSACSTVIRMVCFYHRVFNMSRAFVSQLRATRGSIVNVSSVAGFVAISGVFGYSAAKAGVRSLTQVLARELGADGIRVNAVAPSVIATRMTIPRRQDKEFMDRVMSRTPSGRMGDPEDVAWPIVFLASPLACYVNGVTLPVDGGYLAT